MFKQEKKKEPRQVKLELTRSTVLEFFLDPLVDQSFVPRWDKFVTMMHTDRKKRGLLLETCLKYCNIPSNQSLPILTGRNGGLGKRKGKRLKFEVRAYGRKLVDLVMVPYNAVDGKNKWQQEELLDIIASLAKGFSLFIGDEETIYGRLSIYPYRLVITE